MNASRLDTRQKALEINLDPAPYGTFAEIGAGQEVARWFFRVGAAAGTIAKTVSAYDMAVSTAVYGESDRYVSRMRLESMLDHEIDLLVQRLQGKRASTSTLFAFADTVATRSFSRHKDGDGWMGIRFQHRPQAPPSEVILHVRMYDREATREQEALGVVGVNLVYGAFRCADTPDRLISSLMDGLGPERIEIDTIKFSGPCFDGVDNRLMSLQLVERGFTDATMFTAEGEVVQPAELIYDRPILVERGSFRPIIKPALDMLERVQEELLEEQRAAGSASPCVMMEMTLHNLLAREQLGHCDFLALVDMLGALGKTTMISNYGRHDQLGAYLRRYSKERILFVLGIPGLVELFDDKYYTDLDGGILEGLGRLFKEKVTLHVYPHSDPVSKALVTTESLEVAPHVRHLYAHLVENALIKPVRGFDEEHLDVLPSAVRARIQSGDRSWENMVPDRVVPLIQSCDCPGLGREQ